MLDVVIIGGGVAGLWLLDDLRRAGYSALLIESSALGSGQTIGSQGILHSGLKHALAGRLGTYTDALAGMPAVWRDCLANRREPHLNSVKLRASSVLCWRARGFTSALSQIGAKISLRSKAVALKREERPVPLTACPGDVLRLDELVLDPASLIGTLAARNLPTIRSGIVKHISWDRPGVVREIVVADETRIATLKAKHIVLAAGAGNESLRLACGFASGTMRRLPLPIMVLEGDLPTLNGFCMNGTKAQVIITTQRSYDSHAVWQVACERGSSLPLTEFTAFAWRELKEALPGFRWPTVTTGAYVTDRAEPALVEGRSNDVHASLEGNVITAWPTKLVLAPRLSERIRTLLPAPMCESPVAMDDWPQPHIAGFPWLP